MEKYKGWYNKLVYRIQLKTGEVIERCYPNAGVFHDMSGTGREFKEDEIDMFEPNLESELNRLIFNC